MCVQDNIEVHSGVCILDFAHMLVPFNPQGSLFLLLTSVCVCALARALGMCPCACVYDLCVYVHNTYITVEFI